MELTQSAAMPTKEVIESFTFRNGERHTTVDAVIDTGSYASQITLAIAAQLGLDLRNEVMVRLADGSRTSARLCKCTVAWTIYESQGYYRELEVVCAAGDEVLIGMDFLNALELSVDITNRGLVGHAPSGAQPFTGGGYALNLPNWYFLEMNAERVRSAKPGETLRPHPAWRFTRPAIIKV